MLDDWKLARTELPTFGEQTVAKQLVCVSTSTGSSAGAIYLTISEGKAFAEIYETTPEAEGLLFRLQKVFERATISGADIKRWHRYTEQWDTIVLSGRSGSPPRIASLNPSVKLSADPPQLDIQQTKPEMGKENIEKKPSIHHELKLHAAKTFVQQIVATIVTGISIALGWLAHKFHWIK